MLTIDLTPDTLAERLTQWEEHRQRRLLLEAEALHLDVAPDEITGGWAVRSPQRPGYVEIVTAAGCTCQMFHIAGTCPHSAIATAKVEG